MSTYARLGTPQLGNIAYTDRDIASEQAAIGNGPSEQQIEGLLDKLSGHLDANPDDLKGWLMLGRSLITLGRYMESANAFKRAADLRPADPEILTDYAEALIFANDKKVSTVVYRKLHKAMADAPDNPKTRYYVALYKAQNNDLPGALQEWVDIAAMSPTDAPWMIPVRQQMKAAFSETGINPETIKPTAIALEIAAAMPSPSPSGPSAEEIADARKMSSAEQEKMINAMVERLALRLKENPDDPKGWAQLGRSYQTLNRLEASRDAYANAYSQDPANTETATAYGEVLVFLEQGYVNPQARAVFEKLLKADPKNVKARFYYGLALSETREELPQAIEIWQALLKELPENAPWISTLKAQIKRARKSLDESNS